MVYLGKKEGVIKDGIKTTRDQYGFVAYSCSHREWPNRKAAREHYMKEHLGYKS